LLISIGTPEEAREEKKGDFRSSPQRDGVSSHN